MLKNLKAYKTTVLGLVFLAFAGYAIVQQLQLPEYLLFFIVVSSVLLILSPDKYANILENGIGSILKSDKNKQEENESL